LKQRQKEGLSVALAEKLFNGAHRGAEALVEIQFFDFLIIFFCIFFDFVSLKYEAHQV
jgi:hypothetical protein